jgi:hypothetical protein
MGEPYPRNIVVTGPYKFDPATKNVQLNMSLRNQLIERDELYKEGRIQDDFCRVWKCFFTSKAASWFERQWCRAPKSAGPWHLKKYASCTSQEWLDEHHPGPRWLTKNEEDADAQHLKANQLVEPPPAAFLPPDTRSVLLAIAIYIFTIIQ